MLEFAGEQTKLTNFRTLDRIWYKFENMVERPWSRKILVVMIVTMSIVIQGAVYKVSDGIYKVGDDTTTKYGDAMWVAWTYMTDGGTQADEHSRWARVASAFISIWGILMIAILVGFVVDSVRELMISLKKGTSTVIEEGHVLILGWTDRCPALLRELALACESEGGGTVVILSELEKGHLESEMELR